MNERGTQSDWKKGGSERYVEHIAMPSEQAGLQRALRASFARLTVPEEWKRLLERLR